MPVVMISGFECTRCGHQWVPRQPGVAPQVCPKKTCKSAYWNQPRKEPVPA